MLYSNQASAALPFIRLHIVPDSIQATRNTLSKMAIFIGYNIGSPMAEPSEFQEFFALLHSLNCMLDNMEAAQA